MHGHTPTHGIMPSEGVEVEVDGGCLGGYFSSILGGEGLGGGSRLGEVPHKQSSHRLILMKK